MKFLEKYQFELISIGIITLVIGFLFQKPLTGEYTFTGTDSLSPSAVNQGIIAAEEQYGKYPLWLPWIFSGLPSVHSFQNISDYYFPNIITNIMRYMGIPNFWNYVFHFILAGMGVFFILRQLGTSKYSALFGGIAFALMPYLITMVVHGHGSQMMTTAWLPWVIWAILRLYDEVNIINLSLLAIVVGFQMQRAHAQVAFSTWMLAGLLIIMLLFKIYDKLNKKNQKWLIYTGFAFVLGLCMAMWIYLPVLNYAPYSIRGAGSGGGAGFNYATSWSFSIGEMATFFIPSFYGFGGGTYWGNMPFTDYPNYMGIIVLTFAVIGTLFYDSKIKWYFVIAGLLALFISFGKNFLLYQIFYDYFPYFNKFRIPTMFLILTQFSVAVLAGLGLEVSIKLITDNNILNSVKKMALVPAGMIFAILFLKIFIVSEPGEFPKYPDEQFVKYYSNAGYRLDYIVKNIIPEHHKDVPLRSEVDKFRLKMINKDMGRLFIFLIIVVAAFYSIRNGWIRRQTLAGIIIAASIIDMGIVDHQIIEPDGDSYRNPTINPRSLKSDYLNDQDEVIKFLQEDTSKYRILPLGSLANENRWAAFHIESIEGYHPAKLFHYNQLMDKVGWNSLGVLKMLNVKYVISLQDFPHPDFELIFQGNLFHKGKKQIANVYSYKYFTPRVFFVDKLRKISENDIQFQALKESSFNPRTLSFVEHEPLEFEHSINSRVKIIHWTPDKIEIDVITPTKQFMVISEIFYPGGWQITSHPEWEIHQVNTILRGLYVPEGEYKVTMEFIPQDIYYGSMLTWISSGFIIILLIIGTFINRKSNES